MTELPPRPPDDDARAVDQLLRRRLRAATPTPADPTVRLDELRPRFERARRRRQAATAVLSSAAVLVVVVAGVSLMGRGETQVVTPAGHATSTGSTPSALPPTPPPTTTTTSVREPVERTLTVEGGTVVIRWSPTSITLVSVTPSAGWAESERRTEPTRVEVRFREVDGDDHARVEARVEDGRLHTDLDD